MAESITSNKIEQQASLKTPPKFIWALDINSLVLNKLCGSAAYLNPKISAVNHIRKENSIIDVLRSSKCAFAAVPEQLT